MSERCFVFVFDSVENKQMEGPVKKAIDPRVEAFAALIPFQPDGMSKADFKHDIETRTIPALRRQEPDRAVRRSAMMDTVADRRILFHGVCSGAFSLALVRYCIEECDADIHFVCTAYGPRTALHAVCGNYTPSEDESERDAIVDYLKALGADIDVGVDERGHTKLMRLCGRVTDTDAIRGLIHYGADVHFIALNGSSPLDEAVRHKRSAAPIVVILIEAGAKPHSGSVLVYIFRNMDNMTVGVVHTALMHGSLRNGSRDAMRSGLCKTARAELWCVFARCKHVGLPLLHLAVMYQPAMVPVLMREWVNPVARDDCDRLPRELTTDKHVIAQLDAYAMWTPMRVKTQWYGPLFEQRAVLFVWICKQWATHRVRRLPRDVVHKILAWVAAE